MINSRISLIPISGFKTCYKHKDSENRYNIEELGHKANYVTPDMYEALKKLEQGIISEGGEFFITDLFRDWQIQEKGNLDYITGKRKAFMAPPGNSFHQSGRAVDIDVQSLNFKDAKKSEYIKILWEIAIPIGFMPIIKKPKINLSECWHFQFCGRDWEKAYEKIGDAETAKCTILDSGCWDIHEDSVKIQKMFLQSQLIRLGRYEIGKIDGIIGYKTVLALKSLDCISNDLDEICFKLCNLK